MSNIFIKLIEGGLVSLAACRFLGFLGALAAALAAFYSGAEVCHVEELDQIVVRVPAVNYPQGQHHGAQVGGDGGASEVLEGSVEDDEHGLVALGL